MTGAQSGEPNCDWLMSVWWGDLGEAWLRVTRQLAGWAPRHGRLVEEAQQQGRLVEEV